MELPFPLLQVLGRPLIHRNSLVISPTSSLIPLWQGPALDRKPLAVVIGDSLSDLPHSRLEAERVAAKWHVEPRLGSDVLRWILDGDITRKVDLLHVAAHASFNEDNPDFSGFALADRTIFSARDLRKRQLGARLCVLSACATGRISIGAGDEMRGLVSGLLGAGVRSVIATSWEIHDEATADLVDTFYAALEKDNLAASLRKAQVAISTQPGREHPYYWAAFRLFGYWTCPWPQSSEPPIG